MAKSLLPKYARYKPAPSRPPGAGAFFDFVAGVASRQAIKLKSCSLTRRWGNLAGPRRLQEDEQPLKIPAAL